MLPLFSRSRCIVECLIFPRECWAPLVLRRRLGQQQRQYNGDEWQWQSGWHSPWDCRLPRVTRFTSPRAAPAAGTYNVFANKHDYPQTTTVVYMPHFFTSLTASPALAFVTICQENLQNSSSTVYWDLQARTNNSGQIQLGIEKAPGSGSVVFATTNINVGDTFFVVVRHQILPGSGDDDYGPLDKSSAGFIRCRRG